MIRGFYSAASGLIAGLFRQELISHNLSNINVAGYKGLGTSLDEFNRIYLARFSPEPLGSSGGVGVGATSMGVVTNGPVTNFAPGSLHETDQPFDLALAGDGYFVLQTPDGERYTRDGRFTRDANGHLVSVDGYLLEGTNNNQPVTVPQGAITAISANGTITVDNQAAGQIRLVKFADQVKDLQREGQNTFSSTATPQAATDANLRQGFLEMSNVDPVWSMTQMMTVSRAYESAQRAVQLQDEMLGKAVNELGRV